MLRLETIKCKLCFLSLSNFDVEKLYKMCIEYALSHIQQLICPSCEVQDGYWIRYGHYERWVVTYDPESGTIAQTQLKIQRLLCKHCQKGGSLHTHAILPDFIVPYRQYSIQFILHFLMLYYTRSKTVDQICKEARISLAQLYEWDKTIARNREIWSGILTLDQDPKHVLAEFVRYVREDTLYPDFALQYCKKSLKSFMQNHANPANSHRLRL